MAHVAKFGDKWRAQVAKRGVRKTAVWETRREALDWAAKVEAEIAGGKLKPASRTLRAAVDHYIETVSSTKRNATDWETRRFEAFCEHFGNVPLSSIDSFALGQWRDKRLETVSGSTVMREVNLYRNMFRLAHEEWKWIEASPFKGVRLPKENQPRKAVWRWQEIKKVLRAGQLRGGKTLEVTLAFHIALRTAMRLQEALAAPAGFVPKRGVVIIPPSKMNPEPETVPLTKQGFRLMEKMRPLEVGPNEASTLFSDLCRQLLIEGLQFRDSRATALTLMARKVDILTLSRISRHRDLDLLRSTYYRETADEISARLR